MNERQGRKLHGPPGVLPPSHSASTAAADPIGFSEMNLNTALLSPFVLPPWPSHRRSSPSCPLASSTQQPEGSDGVTIPIITCPHSTLNTMASHPQSLALLLLHPALSSLLPPFWLPPGSSYPRAFSLPFPPTARFLHRLFMKLTPVFSPEVTFSLRFAGPPSPKALCASTLICFPTALKQIPYIHFKKFVSLASTSNTKTDFCQFCSLYFPQCPQLHLTRSRAFNT